jgi:hypothetical protein
VEGFCEYGNDILGIIKGRKFLDWLEGYYVLIFTLLYPLLCVVVHCCNQMYTTSELGLWNL